MNQIKNSVWADLYMNCEIVLKWNTGHPDLVGLYFVAVKYGSGAGEFQFARWEGENWDLQPAGDVEAFVDIQSFKNQLSVQWPNSTKELSDGKKPDKDLWEEV